MFNTDEFLERIEADYNFSEFSPHNQSRLFQTLNYLGSQVQEIFSEPPYSVTFPTDSVRRVPVAGSYYPKEFAVVVNRNEQPIFVLTCHFIASSFKKNINNSFENMLGDCSNLQSNGVKYGSIHILQTRFPVKDGANNITGWDFLNGLDLERHIKLSLSDNAAHKPFTNSVLVIETPVEGQEIALSTLAGIDDEIRNSVFTNLTVANAFTRLIQLRNDLEE
jgi:hypothetical protein